MKEKKLQFSEEKASNKNAKDLKYHSINELLALIDSPYREKCQKMLKDFHELFSVSRGSKTKHQAWEGGYLDHIEEVMNLAILFFGSLEKTKRKLTFSLSDALLVLYLHDLEKPWKQKMKKKGDYRLEKKDGSKDEKEIKEFTMKIKEKYNFKFTNEHLNALKYCEGEKEDYHPFKRIQNELAAFCNMCDLCSARIFHDYPKKKCVDEWKK